MVDALRLPEGFTETFGWTHTVSAGNRFTELEFNVYPSGWPPVLTDDLAGEVTTVIAALRERTGSGRRRTKEPRAARDFA